MIEREIAETPPHPIGSAALADRPLPNKKAFTPVFNGL